MDTAIEITLLIILFTIIFVIQYIERRVERFRFYEKCHERHKDICESICTEKVCVDLCDKCPFNIYKENKIIK